MLQQYLTTQKSKCCGTNIFQLKNLQGKWDYYSSKSAVMVVRKKIILIVLSRLYMVERELSTFLNFLFPVETTKEFIFPTRNLQV